VVLITLGSVVAFLAVLWRKHSVLEFAAVLLGLGTMSAWAAVTAGKFDAGLLENTTPEMDVLLQAHAIWAHRTLTAVSVAALAAICSALLTARHPLIARGTAIAAALAAGLAAYAVFETGQRGGSLVFRFGAGVQIDSPKAVPSDSSTPDQSQAASRAGQ